MNESAGEKIRKTIDALYQEKQDTPIPKANPVVLGGFFDS